MQQGYGSRGSGQPEKLRFPRFSRPHLCVHSERQPKECAGSRKEKERKETKKNKKKGKERRLVRYRAERARAKGKGEGCHSHAPTLNEHSPSAFPLQAGGRRIPFARAIHFSERPPMAMNNPKVCNLNGEFENQWWCFEVSFCDVRGRGNVCGGLLLLVRLEDPRGCTDLFCSFSQLGGCCCPTHTPQKCG